MSFEAIDLVDVAGIRLEMILCNNVCSIYQAATYPKVQLKRNPNDFYPENLVNVMSALSLELIHILGIHLKDVAGKRDRLSHDR